MPNTPRVKKEMADILARTTEVGGCRIFNGAPHQDRHGYARRLFVGSQKLEYVHRVVLSLKLGRPIKDGYEACHVCDVPMCVSPDHLFEGTHADNLRMAAARGHLSRPNARRLWTHCIAGHPFDDANTIYIQGGRRCRACKNRRDREYAATR